jgi:hypothetical protein
MNCKKLETPGLYLRVCYRCGAPRHKCLQDGQCGALGARLNRLMQEDEERGEGEAGFRRSGEGC